MEPSPLMMAAIQLHELYTIYTQAGFTEEQALELVKVSIANAGKSS